jgi:site-specific DNA-adenine methylase
MNQLTFDFFQDTIKHKGLPYIGSKFKYLDQILIHFPEDIHSFYEPFCGGMNLTLNVTAKEFFINDRDMRKIDNKIQMARGLLLALGIKLV